ncbi:MAG: 7-cyano-7-deazaguanine synthase QueC [Candidatus Omnitrophota bacterium]
MNKKAIVLLSGGLDSATTLYLAKARGFKCFCLTFDYGQRHRREIVSAKIIAKGAKSPYQVLKIKLPWKGSVLLDRKQKLPVSDCRLPVVIPSTYVPGRNIIFLSFALSCAEAVGAEAILIGANAIDFSGYPDCRPQFYRAFNRVVKTGTKAGAEKKAIKILTPLIRKNKAEIIRLGARLGVPFHLTWSCYQGGKLPCGKCDSCYFRAKGFKEANLRDTLLS